MGRRARVRRWRAGVTGTFVLVLGLAGCGSVPAVDAGPGAVPTGGPPTTLPFVREAPPEFTQRAEHIVRTMRESGALTAYANTLVLTSPRVQWADYGAKGELKAVLGNGGFEAGPAITDVAQRGTVVLEDGTTMDVPLLGARTTLADSKKGLPGCVGVGDTPCPLVMTSARLGTLKVETNRGPATVPAWEFSAAELVTPHVVVAVDPAALGDLPEPVFESSDWPHTLSSAERLLAVQRSSLSVMITFGACETDRAVHVHEADDVVVVGGSHTPTGGICHAIGYNADATIPLSEPLGGRPVVDVIRGRILVPQES